MRPLVAVLALAVAAAPTSATHAFRAAPLGTPIRDRGMPTVDGKRSSLLAAGRVSVFVFVRTGQEFSATALRQLAVLEKELAGKPVRLVAVVSDGEVPSEVARLAAEAGFRSAVLVDQGDALYGELGVAMYPSGGIVGRDGRLAGFQPFRKINYLDAMRGQVQFALGEIDGAALARVLDPGVQAAPSGGRARARLKLARTLLASGLFDQAVENARASVALEPELADAHQVLSDALAKAGKCEEAAREAEAAHRLGAAAGPALACLRN